MGRDISISISAKDNFTATIAKVKTATSGLGTSLDGLSQKLEECWLRLWPRLKQNTPRPKGMTYMVSTSIKRKPEPSCIPIFALNRGTICCFLF